MSATKKRQNKKPKKQKKSECRIPLIGEAPCFFLGGERMAGTEGEGLSQQNKQEGPFSFVNDGLAAGLAGIGAVFTGWGGQEDQTSTDKQQGAHVPPAVPVRSNKAERRRGVCGSAGGSESGGAGVNSGGARSLSENADAPELFSGWLMKKGEVRNVCLLCFVFRSYFFFFFSSLLISFHAASNCFVEKKMVCLNTKSAGLLQANILYPIQWTWSTQGSRPNHSRFGGFSFFPPSSLLFHNPLL